MNKKVFIFFPSEADNIILKTVDCWKKFFQLDSSGGWLAEEIEQIPFLSVAEIRQFWDNHSEFDFAVTVILGKKHQYRMGKNIFGEDSISIDTQSESVAEHIFYPTTVARKRIIIFDVVMSEDIWRLVDRQLTAFCEQRLSVENLNAYTAMIARGDYGDIFVKPKYFNSRNNFLYQVLLLYHENSDNTLSLVSIDGVIGKMKTSALRKIGFVCNSGRRLYSFPGVFL